MEPSEVAIFVNGSIQPGTTYGVGGGTAQNAGQSVITLLAGDVVTVRNHTSAGQFNLETLAGGTAVNVNASIYFQQIGP